VFLADGDPLDASAAAYMDGRRARSPLSDVARVGDISQIQSLAAADVDDAAESIVVAPVNVDADPHAVAAIAAVVAADVLSVPVPADIAPPAAPLVFAEPLPSAMSHLRSLRLTAGARQLLAHPQAAL
jgi:hypothetical protein